MLKNLATILEAVANQGAGATSMLFTYQPETPKCLKEED